MSGRVVAMSSHVVTMSSETGTMTCCIVGINFLGIKIFGQQIIMKLFIA